MNLKPLPRKHLCMLLATPLVFVSSIVQAQYFLDDFEDGSATDGNPVTWARYAPPFDQGSFAVEGGSLVITPPTSGPLPVPSVPDYWETDVYVADHLYHDVNVLTQVRGLAQGPSLVGISALDTEAILGPSGNGAGGYILLDGSTTRLHIGYNVGTGDESGGSINTSLSHLTDELNLRFVVSGLRLSLTAWPVGTPEPNPQMSIQMLSGLQNLQGHVSVFVGNRSTSVPVAFRFVEVVPEPSSVTLAVLAMAVFRTCRWRSRASIS